MRKLLAASLGLFVLLSAPAAFAKCKKGEVSDAGMCMRCPSQQYVEGNTCKSCPEGFTTTTARNGCKKKPVESGLCKTKGYGKQGGMCMPCHDAEYVAKNVCRSCPEGFTTNKARTGCVQLPK